MQKYSKEKKETLEFLKISGKNILCQIKNSQINWCKGFAPEPHYRNNMIQL